ncbi:uncharacterized protein DS421_9g284030 [Arachis hypogaea]|nr:uncharacterized protein DS421_9g284030 [Arachis hypogaea]
MKNKLKSTYSIMHQPKIFFSILDLFTTVPSQSHSSFLNPVIFFSKTLSICHLIPSWNCLQRLPHFGQNEDRIDNNSLTSFSSTASFTASPPSIAASLLTAAMTVYGSRFEKVSIG